MHGHSPFIHEWVFAHAERRPEAPAVATLDARIGYGDLAVRVLSLAGHLGEAGIRPGDRVAVTLPNTVATIVTSLALQAIGATPVELNREWNAEVLGGLVAQTGVRQAFVFGRDARTWARVAADRSLQRLWCVHDGPLPERLAADLGPTPVTLVLADGRVDPKLGAAPPPRLVSRAPEEPAILLFTSGSTGRPRGVIQTFKNVDANTRSIVEYLSLDDRDRALLILPLHYCYGRSVLQTHLFAGGSVYLENRFAFPRVALETLGAERCTGMAGVPLTFEIIRRQVDVSTLSLPTLRYLTQAGGAMAPETIDWVREAFAPTKLFVMYGQTEATARLSYLPPERGREKRGSIGVAIPRVELRVVDDAGNELPRGEPGHLVARGDNVTGGYLDEPAETAAILHDGWLWTGDLALRDEDGFFFIRGRSKEILKIGGHRVSPTEIDHHLAEHPDVAEAAVVGQPDPLMGEVPIAFVKPRPDRTPTEDALKAFCRTRMPAYQVPVRFILVESLPRNGAGKILRAQLAAEYASGAIGGGGPAPAKS